MAEKTGEAKGKEQAGDVNEMDIAQWSVVSFDRAEASGLTYDQARKRLEELDAADAAGLCIVTDSAARRMTEAPGS